MEGESLLVGSRYWWNSVHIQWHIAEKRSRVKVIADEALRDAAGRSAAVL